MAPLVEEIKKQEIVDQLAWDNSVNANAVHVDVQDGTVQLKGKVSNYTAKLAAERDAYLVQGVNIVENYLEIEFPPKFTIPSDDEITSNIYKMLIWNSNIDSSDIKVETSAGTVTLSGNVSSYWEKFMAEDIANSTNGVIGVVNDLEVVLIKTIEDVEIENDIRRAYKRSVLISEDEIQVSVNNGIVQLSGKVPTYPIKKEAYDIAVYTGGVTDVIDDIKIS
jgi:osmotically-inducible protein OsmY